MDSFLEGFEILGGPAVIRIGIAKVGKWRVRRGQKGVVGITENQVWRESAGFVEIEDTFIFEQSAEEIQELSLSQSDL